MDHLPPKQELPAIVFRINFKHHNMKPLLLIGAALMVGAGIYGFVDYKKANHKKEFQTLYREDPTKDVQMPTPAPPAVDSVPEDVPVYGVKNGKVVVVKPAA